MGTRNLTCVMIDGEYKVAQYAQWDGYPEGQGATALSFLLEAGNIEKLKASLGKVRYLDDRDKEFLEEYNKNAPTWSNEPDNRTDDQRRWQNLYISRDIGAEILSNIANSTDTEIVLQNSLRFAEDSLFCEFAYVVDFDKGTFGAYKGFNKTPLSDDARFKDMNDKESDYYPISLLAEFKLDNLPTEQEFLEKCTEKDDTTSD